MLVGTVALQCSCTGFKSQQGHCQHVLLMYPLCLLCTSCRSSGVYSQLQNVLADYFASTPTSCMKCGQIVPCSGVWIEVNGSINMG